MSTTDPEPPSPMPPGAPRGQEPDAPEMRDALPPPSLDGGDEPDGGRAPPAVEADAERGVEPGVAGEPSPSATASKGPAHRLSGRPRTATTLRNHRITVYADDEQKQQLTERARTAGLTISSYLVARGLQSQVVARGDWQRVVERLTAVERHLDALAQHVSDRARPVEALRITAALLAVERAARGLAMPWQRAIAEAADDLDPSAFWPAGMGGNTATQADDEDAAYDEEVAETDEDAGDVDGEGSAR